MSELQENCGLFGVFGDPEAAGLVALGLFALQHRGEESAGIVAAEGGQLSAHHGLGLVSNVFTPERLAQIKGTSAIGHCRYATAGGSGIENAQPLLARYAHGQIAVAHNGTLTNAQTLRHELEAEGSIFRTTSDSEVILHLLALSKQGDTVARLKEALPRVQGAYSLVLLTETALYAVRDPFGFRPLVIGQRNGSHDQPTYIVASETCALDMIEAKYLREIEPGELVKISASGLESFRLVPEGQPIAPCVFEHIYFSRPDSHVFGRDVYAVRKNLGRELARLHPADADVVIPVPDSGVPAAIGFSEVSKIPFDMALTRSHYVGRSFIQPQQAIRTLAVRLKLATAGVALRGKRVVVVDDSLVRGTTSRKIVQLLRQAGASEVHLRISAPPTISPCYYGIDMPTKGELIAGRLDLKGIKDFVTADSIGYLDIDALRRAVSYREGQFCEACFTDKYPVTPQDSLVQLKRPMT